MKSEPHLEIKSREILSMIEKGDDIDYSNIMIADGLDLSKLKLEKDEEGRYLVTSQIRIRNSIIQGIVKFDDTIFERLVDFDGTSFDLAGFRYTKFCKYAGFEDTAFTGYAAFEHTQFMGEANFSNAQFANGADAYFFEAKFRDNAFFWSKDGENILFSGDAHFQHAEFHKLAEFSQSKFHKIADFAFCRFNGEDAIFMSAQFGGPANFTGAKFKGDTYFWKTHFEGSANFIGAKFKGEIDFRNAQFDKDFDLRGARFTQFLVGWESIKNQLVHDGLVLLALTNSFKILGQFEDADDCYYAYRSHKDDTWMSNHINRTYDGLLHSFPSFKCIDILASLTCGYGVRPGRTIMLSLGIILAFALLFWIKSCFWINLLGDGLIDRTHTSGNISVVSISDTLFQTTYAPGSQAIEPSASNILHIFFNDLYFSAMVFVSQVPSNWYIEGIWKYIIMLERLLGGGLMALFIVVLTKKLIR